MNRSCDRGGVKIEREVNTKESARTYNGKKKKRGGEKLTGVEKSA